MLNCGRNLLSLDASFSAMRVANSHFWNSLAKLGRLISGAPGGSSIQTLLEGSAVYNMQIRTPLLRMKKNSKEIDRAYGQVHEFATKQYRSLMKDANKIPQMTVDMIKETGTKTMLFAQKLLADSKKFATRANGYKMGAQYVTATPGSFLRRLPGASIGVAAFGASVIDTSQFAWRFVTRLVLKLLAVNEGMSLAPALWQATADSMDDYTTYLVKPAFRACSGIGIMMGYSNPWARLFRESCSAAVASQATAVSTGLVLFVDIPTLACMCKDADGRNFAIYARETCWTPAPLHIRPLLASLISDHESGLGQKDICQKMGLYTEDKMRAIMDPVMQHGYAATEAVGSSLDYLTTLFDPTAGSCKDVINSPYTMALVPEPVDYFRGCAKTQSCRSRCITLFNEFEDAKSHTLESESTFDFKSKVAKKFFSNSDMLLGRAAAPFEVLAMLEVPAMDLSTVNGLPCCGGGDPRDRCIAVVGITDTTELEVVEYCIPHRLDVGTHEHARWLVAGSSAWVSDMHSVRFATRDILFVALRGTVVMYRVDGNSLVVMEPLAAGQVPWEGQARMHRIAWIFVAPGNYAIVHGFVNSATSVSTQTSVCVRLDGPRVWPMFYPSLCSHNLHEKLDDHVATCLGNQCAELLLLPTTSGGVMRYCNPDIRKFYTGRNMEYICVDSAPRPNLAQSLGFGEIASTTFIVKDSFVGMRRSPSLCANTLFPGNASLAENDPAKFLTANPTSTSSTWLQEITIGWDRQQGSKLLYADKSLSQNIDVSLSIVQRCDTDECSGCVTPAVQRACYAAQQCAIAKCIGTVVNLERPLCSVGRVLQAGLDVDLAKMHGVWTVMTDLVSFVLRAATGMDQTGVELEFIDEIFFSVICEAKNGIIASMGIITSLINGIVNTADRALRSSVGSMVGLDQDAANAEAVRTMTAAATTNFLTQIALGVLYPPIVFKKTIICHTDAFLSIFDVTGFKLRVSSQKYAAPTNALVGRCLSEYHKESLQDPQSQDSQTGFAAVLQGIAIDAGTAVAQIPFERMLHTMDAAFAYAIGVLSGLQDVVATADQRHCNLPDIEAADISTCSCGDTPMMIPDDRADSESSRFWCTGVLSLISSTGEAYLGINPYTYAQITHMSSSQDTYLECVSAGNTDAPCNKGPPNDYAYGGHLAIQGISLMTVATRCKSNYANSQWDDGAAALFSDPLPKSLAGTNTRKTHELRESFIQNVDPTVVACLVLSLQEGGSNDACLQDFLTQRNQRRQLFFQYIPIDSHITGTQFIAACEVFTGPATSTSMSADAKLPFKQCLDEYPDVGCTTPGMVWAGRSANRVSVATTHARVDSDHSRRLQIARATLSKVRTDVLATLNDPKITSWNADLLELAIFTAEGDALHQLFDALVLGPYARAGMWPTDIEHQLPRLDWYRDTHGGTTREFELPCAGDSLRGVHTAPYTCGSATRRSVIRYFMKEVFSTGKEELNNAVQRAVHAMISNLKSVWSTDYGCECATDNHLKLAIAMGETDVFIGKHDVACCDPDDPGSFLPSFLHSTPYTTLHGASLVKELFTMIGNFVQNDLWTRSSSPFTEYNLDILSGASKWNKEQKILAADMGLFRTDMPLLSYDSDEVSEPFGGDAKNVSMWRTCHGFLQQTLATLPMGGDGMPVGVFKNNPLDPTAFSGEHAVSELERMVRTMTSKAWLVSPLHYSHSMRHLPSDSLVCESAYTEESEFDERVSPLPLQREYVNGIDVLGSGFPIADMASIHVRAGGLGSVRRACLCGWVSETACYLPQEVCDGVYWPDVDDTVASYCALEDSGNRPVPRPDGVGGDGDKVRDVVIAEWVDDWVCDSMAPSESWGVLNETNMQNWMAGNSSSLSIRETLQHGRVGIRVGSFASVIGDKEWKRVLNPGRRTIPLTGLHNGTVGQRWCMRNHAEMLPASFADRFVDELFPIAQGVTESAGLAFCLRVVVESARLRVLQLAAAGTSGDVSKRLYEAIEGQENVLSTWRRRCMQQVDMVGMCMLRGVFAVQPVLEPTPKCPFELTHMPQNGAWLTPGCVLRWTDDRYFYPCLCNDCSGPLILSVVHDVVNKGSCEMAINPNTFLLEYKKKSSLFWATDFTHEKDTLKRSMLTAQVLALHEERKHNTGVDIQKLLTDYIHTTDTVNETRGTFGNADGSTKWFAAEGLAHDGSTQFCDIIHDWWPESWEQPVGVHVTTPCHSSETAYRGFDNAFTTDRQYEPPRMVYRHNELRDAKTTRNDIGSSGLCRHRSLGMPIQDMNNMRFCTKMDLHARSDTSVPLSADESDGQKLEPERVLEVCAEDHDGVPWDAHEQFETYRRSAGVVLSWPDFETHWVWPSYIAASIPLATPPDIVDSNWGDGGCGLYPLLTCITDSNCQDLSTDLDVDMKCMGSAGDVGVCVVQRQDSGEVHCVRHIDCSAGFMCAGDGLCVPPVASFINSRDEEIETHMYAPSCVKDENVDLYGFSPWEQVPDILRANGLCSHRKWYEYRTMLAGHTEQCTLDAEVGGIATFYGKIGGGVCKIPTQRSYWQYTGTHGDGMHKTEVPLQEDGVLSVHAHTCDRDFMYLDGYAQCQPKKVILRHWEGNSVSANDADFGRSFATYTSGNHTIPYARMPFFENHELGFLGTSHDTLGIDLLACSSIPHCALQPFTIRGFTVPNRLVFRTNSLAGPQDYKMKDSIKCGAFGYITNPSSLDTVCKVDLDVVPFFRVVCSDENSLIDAKCSWRRDSVLDTYTRDGTQLSRQHVCSSITNSYMPGDKDDMRLLVNQLPYQLAYWSEGGTLDEYLDQVSCAEFVLRRLEEKTGVEYTTTEETPRLIRSIGLYHFLDFSLYEVAPMWWVKCVLFSRSVEGSFTDTEARCAAWDGDFGSSLNAYTWLTKNVGHVSAHGIQSYQDAIKGAVRQAGVEKILDMFHEIETMNHNEEGGFTFVNFFNPTCFSSISLNLERIEAEKSNTEPSQKRMLNKVRELVALRKNGAVALGLDDLTWDQITCSDTNQCMIPEDRIISSESISLIELINTHITGDGAVQRQNYLDSVEFDRDVDGIHLFRLPELEDISPGLLQEVGKLFKTDNMCLLDQGSGGSESICLYDEAFYDPNLSKIANIIYSREKSIIQLSIGPPGSAVAMHGKAWVANQKGTESGTVISFDPCAKIQPGTYADTCSITKDDTCAGHQGGNWMTDLGAGTCGPVERGAQIPQQRSYSVNHKCFLGEVPDDGKLGREETGSTMVTGAQDDRVARFSYVKIPSGMTFTVHHTPKNVLLEANEQAPFSDMTYTTTYRAYLSDGLKILSTIAGIFSVTIPVEAVVETLRGFKFTNAWAFKDLVYQSVNLKVTPTINGLLMMPDAKEDVEPVLPRTWTTLFERATTMIDSIDAHVPRYVSDYYESVLRDTDDVSILHLYDCDHVQGVPSVRGMDRPTTSEVFKAKSSFEPFPSIRFAQSNQHGFRVLTLQSYQPVSRMAFAQFSGHQVPSPYFDPAYPSALHTKEMKVYTSLGNLRHLIQTTLDTHGMPGSIQCDACVRVHHKEYDRFTGGKTKRDTGSIPGSYHTWDHAGHASLRTLQDIVDATGHDHSDQPWSILATTYEDFSKKLKDLLPVFSVKMRDLAPWGSTPPDINVIPFLHNLNTDTNTAEVDISYFMAMWLKSYLAEAKLVYIASNWPALSKHWFEVYNRVGTIQKGPWSGDDQGSQTAIENAGVVGYTVGMEKDTFCRDSSSPNADCGHLRLGVVRSPNTMKCYECTHISKTLCTGRNNCGPPIWLRAYMDDDFKKWIKVGPKTATLQTIIDGTSISPEKHVEIVWAILRTAIINDPSLNIIESIRDSRNNNVWAQPRISVPFVIHNNTDSFFGGGFDTNPLTWESWGSYNPEGAIKYEQTTGVINPITKISEVGACAADSTPETNFVDYTKCDMHAGIEFLARHTVENFSHKRGVRIPTGSRASWEITRDQMTGTGVVPFWANANRASRDRFVSWIVDHKEHCRNHHGDRTQSVCYQDHLDAIRLFNPWLGGDFAPVDKCDYTYQQEKFSNVIDTICADGVCDSAYGMGEESIFSKEQYAPDGGESCWQRNGQIPTNTIVGFSQRNNLCSKSLRTNATCEHRQGTLAGPGKPAGSVYTTFPATDRISMRTTPSSVATSDALGGLLVQPRHTAFTGQGYSTSTGNGNGGALRVSPYDITGHHIRYVVSEHGITVGDVMLQSYKSLEDADLQKGAGTSWFHEFDTFLENNQATPELQWKTAWSDWACPLRQQTFLQGGRSDFKPQKPDQRRARVLFSETNKNLFVHPTQKSGEGTSPDSIRYYTGNGVCACATPGQCQFDLADTGVCGFVDTLKSLHDNSWRQSRVFDNKKCNKQVDWPYTGGEMRDGSTLPTNTGSSTCGLLSRLPIYEYRYESRQIYPAPAGSRTTLSSAGDCHTGRVADADTQGIPPECTLLHHNISHLILKCESETLALPRMMSDMPADVMRRVHSLRRKCNQCSAAPTFHSSNGNSLPEAESSVTHPYRVSTQRVMASDLRNDLSRALCDSVEGCPQLEAVINRSHWVPEKFWHTFMGDVRQLLNTTLTPTQPMPSIGTIFEGSTTSESYTENDANLWERPWLMCIPAATECHDTCDVTNGRCDKVCKNPENNAITCTGTMDRENWMDPSTRVTATIEAFTKTLHTAGDNGLIQNMNVCDLDVTLAGLCKDIQTARGAVFEGNCQGVGSCLHELFYYQPSMFSLSNNQFVRQTVEEFYRHIHPNSCIVQTSQRKEDLKIQNAALVEQCPATGLEKFKDILKMARVQCASFIRAGYFLAMIVLHAVRMMIPITTASAEFERDDALTQMKIYFDLLMEELSSAMMAFMDLVMKLLLGTEIGLWLEELMLQICLAVNWVIQTFFLDLFCPLRSEFVNSMTQIIRELEPIASVQIGGWFPFAWLNIQGLKDIKTAMQTASCDPEDVLKNCYPVDKKTVDPIARIDVATRCWSTYVNSLGDASSLSCSAADSCLQYDSTNAYALNGLVACDDCPIQPLQDFQRFGCDIIRKQCKCNVQSVARTACINHAQCQNTEATCDMLDTAFSPGSFGTTPCASCSSAAMCLDAPGGARCACPLREHQFETCGVSEVSMSIVPDPLGLCLVTLGQGAQSVASRSVDYTLQYAELAAAPCAILSNAQTFCYTVHSADWTFATFVVGLERLDIGRRRLLEENVVTTTPGMVHIAPHDLDRVAALPWNTVMDDGCRLVGPLGSLIFETNLSVSDHLLYKQCVRWRAIGDDVRRAFNLSVPDTFLLSMKDLTYVLRDPAVVIQIVSHPEILVYTLLHSEAAAPVRALMRSVRVWVAHGMSYLVENARWVRGQLDNTRNVTDSNITGSNTTESGFSPNSHRHLHTTQSLLLELRRVAPMPYAEPLEHVVDAVVDVVSETIEEVIEDASDMTHERRLLAFQDRMDSVKTYSTQLALGDGATQLMGGSLSDAFANIPISLTPENGLVAECTAVSNLATVVEESFELIHKYVGSSKFKRPHVERGFLLSFPTFGTTYRKPDVNNQPIVNSNQNSLAGGISRFIFETMGVLDPNYVRDVFADIPGIVKRLMKCDMDTVMYCSEFRYSLLSSAFIVATLLYIGGVLVASLGVPYVWTILALIYIPSVLFYSMGYSPMCVPLVPTCIGDEIISMFDTLIPTRINWPQSLQQSPNCIDNSNMTTSECIVSCSAHPFNFRGWYEGAAWTLCELNKDVCIAAHNWLQTQSFAAPPDGLLYDLSSALWRSHMVISQGDADLVTAYRVCAIFTSWRLVPAMFLVVVCIYTIPVLIMIPIQILFSALQLTLSSIGMSHTHVRAESLNPT